jgi:putative ABC transport system permease protein
VPTLLRYWRRLLRRDRLERELDDELRATLDLLIDEKRRAGMTPEAAVRAARLELGGVESLKEQVRDVVGVRVIDDLRRDCRLAVRTLRAGPIVTGAAVLSLALAIGANTAVFSMVNGLVLRTLPVRDPAGLVFLSDARVAPRVRVWEYSFWQQIQQRPQLFEFVAASSLTRFNLASGGESQFVEGMWATGSFFDTLGVAPVLGRTFSDVDDRRGGGPDGPVTVISHAYWQRAFGGGTDVIGRVVRLNMVPFTIVGVMPSGFFGTEVGRTFDVIAPLHTEPLVRGRDAGIDNPGTNFLSVIARLAPGQTMDSAAAELRRVQPAIRTATMPARGGTLPQAFLDQYLRDPFVLAPAETGFSNLRLQYQRPLLVITAVVALVLLIACVNIANLLLARAMARRHELQVRLALGASRWRLARQLFTESLVLSAAGAALGVGIAPPIGRFLVGQLTTPTNVVFLDTSLDLRVLAFSIAVTVITALLFGTSPAFRAARVSLVDALKVRGHAAGEPRGGPAGWLVVVQVALSVTLVVAAGLFLRSFASLASRELGFEAERVLVVTIDPERAAVDVSQRRALYRRVRAAVLAVPDVREAALSHRTPITTGGFTPQVAVDGRAPAVIHDEVFGNLISPGWLRTYGMPLVAGRDITERDRGGAPRVAIVNETFARRYLAGGSPQGRIITIFPGTPRALRLEVVGVAADAVYFSAREPVPPSWYGAIDQFEVDGFPFSPVRLSVRPGAGSPAALTKDVEAAIVAVDPQLALTFRPLAEQVDASLTRERLMAQLAAFFGGFSLLLAGIGLYGVTAYAISRRRAEIGIRMALGAAPRGVVRLVAGQVTMLVATGIGVGAALSLWAARFVGGLIYGLQPRDPSTLIGAVIVLSVTAALAGWVPVRRAVRTDPAAVLRES